MKCIIQQNLLSKLSLETRRVVHRTGHFQYSKWMVKTNLSIKILIAVQLFFKSIHINSVSIRIHRELQIMIFDRGEGESWFKEFACYYFILPIPACRTFSDSRALSLCKSLHNFLQQN